jgi:hypothetical protein
MNTADQTQTPAQPDFNTAIRAAGTTTRLRRTRPLTFIAGFAAAIVLTGGGAAAYAANGGPLLIGRSNSGSATTTLSNSGGTALKLNSKSGTAPLAVNRSTKVTNLNADYLDGRSDASYALAGGQTGVIFSEAEWVDLDEDLVNDALLAVAVCPAGTKLTGGGVDNFTGGATFFNGPDADGAWYGAAEADPAVNLPEDVAAYAICYNPRGVVPGAMSPATARSDSPEAIASERLAQMLAKR